MPDKKDDRTPWDHLRHLLVSTWFIWFPIVLLIIIIETRP